MLGIFAAVRRAEILEAALAYRSEGLVTIPLRADQKIPALEGWPEERSQSEARVRDLFASHDGNLGIVCGSASRLVVVDIDTKKGKRGEESLSRWEERHGPLPRTRTIATPNGGVHLYYRTPIDLHFRTCHVMGPGIDVMGGGGQIVAPPSILDSGPYAVIDDAPIADCPEAILSALGSPEAKIVDAAAIAWTPVPKDDPSYAERIAIQRAAFETTPLYLEGEGWGNVRYVMLFQRLGPGLRLDYETTLRAYADHYDPRLPAEHRWIPRCTEEIARVAARAYERPLREGHKPDQYWRELHPEKDAAGTKMGGLLSALGLLGDRLADGAREARCLCGGAGRVSLSGHYRCGDKACGYRAQRDFYAFVAGASQEKRA